MKHIIIVAATKFEVAPFMEYVANEGNEIAPFEYLLFNHHIHVLITGVGSFFTGIKLLQKLHLVKADMLINAGIAGAFDRSLDLGEVVYVYEDQFADLGVEESDASFTDVFDLELQDPDQYPLSDARLKFPAQYPYLERIKQVKAITVNKVHGAKSSIDQIIGKYPGIQIESMEGAAFYYTAKMAFVDAVQIRSISNYVEPRNKENWNIDGAIAALNFQLIHFLQEL